MSTESAKENWEVTRGEREPNGCRQANLDVLALVRMHDLGQESISQAVKRRRPHVPAGTVRPRGSVGMSPVQFVVF